MPSSPDPSNRTGRPTTRIPVPVACSLDNGAARAQLGEWQALLAASVVSSERQSATTYTLQLDPATDLGRLAALAQREVACCPFFRFEIRLDAGGIRLSVSVPADAAPILDAFSAFAS